MKIIKLFFVLIFVVSFSKPSIGQLTQPKESFNRADTLRGMLTPLRTCYDINFYHLQINVDIANQYLRGSNKFHFTATRDFKNLQFDLFENLSVEKVTFQGKALPFKREYNAVFLTFPDVIKKGSKNEFTVFYAGHPIIAKQAPWDGGFVFSKDAAGKPWVAVACQGLGASSWWPTKDHQADEVDSMMISVDVPDTLMNVSNGRLRSTEKLSAGYTRYNWFVSKPINNYNVSLNIADYVHFEDVFSGEKGSLTLDYYVLRGNLEKAKHHFTTDVKPMLRCFEHWFGPYPFYSDGYKLVETPYLGMEHQSAIAYGNKYQKGYLGKDLSGTTLGLDWDYIIVHESGHEWFGNNITAKDIADMWIHEAFTMYSEALYIECQKGKDAGARYIAGVRKAIQNDRPIIGPYHVNKEGSGDMYYKGANMLQTIRSVINDDKKWLDILRGLNSTFGLKTTTTEEIVAFINKKSGNQLTNIFDQYLRYPNIPILEIKNNADKSVSYRWKTDVSDFRMPVNVKKSIHDNWQSISPENKWKTLNGTSSGDLIIDTLHFYINVIRK